MPIVSLADAATLYRVFGRLAESALEIFFATASGPAPKRAIDPV
jgi:hypothetical protein